MGKNAPALSSFAAGELSPDMAGRVDMDKYPVGCDTLRNFIPRVQGPSRRRPGTRYVTSVANSANRTWLRRFIFSQGQAYQIEFGAGYCRFYTNHGQVLLSGTPYQIASPYGASDITNPDGSCGLQLEQSGDVVYITCGTVWPQTLTRLGPTNWVFAPYAPTDGPFLDRNTSNTPALYVTLIPGSPNQATIKATAACFDPSDAPTATSPGRLVRIDIQYFNVQTWVQNQPNAVSGAHVAGDLVRWNGNTYEALNAGISGPNPPIQTQGTQWDGPGNGTATGVQWLYLDSGYGIAQVSTYVSPTQVTVTLSAYAGQIGKTAANQYYRFPAAVVGAAKAITGITAASPPVVASTAHGFLVGDPVYLTGVGGMTQISEQMYVITAVADANHFTLGTEDASGYSAYTSGGTAIKNASLRWQIGAWGGIANPNFPGSFPVAVSFYSDRLFMAGGIKWWGSAPGEYDSHTQDLFSLVTDACAVAGLIAAQDVDSITWLSPLLVLLMGTKGGEFGLGPIVATAPLGPDNVAVTRFSRLRSRQIRAEIIGTSNFYVQASGKKVMAQDYNFWLQIYDSTNQTRIANHIAGYTVASSIIDMSYHAEPYETLWCVRSDGVLIGYTFDKADNVTGWHEHAIGGTVAGAAVVECVSVIPSPDGTRDELWMIVRRSIGGQTVRSVEYMEKDYETGDAQNSACYLDMSGQYSGVPTTTVTGLSWLNGETVAVFRDGGGHPNAQVSGSVISLQTPGSVVQVGLACPAALVTMDVEGGADVGTAQGKTKRPVVITVRLKNTLGGHIGMKGSPTQDLLQPNEATTALASPPPFLTGDTHRISVPGDYDTHCKIQITQPDPFPMEIIAIFPSITVQEPSPQ